MAIIPKLHRLVIVFPTQLSDSQILVSWPCPEAHSGLFSNIQTHFSHRFCLAVDSLGLRRNGSSSEIINQAQDFLEQASRRRHLGQLEGNVPTMADHLGTDLDVLLPERRQRPVPDLLGQYRLLLMAMNRPSATRNRLPLYLRKQTFSWLILTSGCDPTRTFQSLSSGDARWSVLPSVRPLVATIT